MLKSLGAPVVAATVLCGLFSGSDARAEGNDRAAAQATYGVLITPRDPETSKGSNAASIAWQQDVRIKRTIHIDTGKDFFNAVRNLKGAGRKVDLLVINGEGASNKPSLSFKPNPGDGDYLDPTPLEFAVRNPSFQGFMSKDGAVLLLCVLPRHAMKHTLNSRRIWAARFWGRTVDISSDRKGGWLQVQATACFGKDCLH